MKYLFLLLFASFMLALPTALDAQCPVGNVTLNSQAEVDNFAVSYPNCSQISGSLTIEGSDITDLQGLNNLSSVGTFLLIRGNGALTSLQGLNNLSSVGNNLFILVNAALTSLQGLDNLSSVGSNIYIGSNDALTSLQGLDNLSSVGNEIAIRYNDALASLQGLDNLSSVGNDIFIIDNDALTSLQGLSSLSSLVGDLQIEENDALTSLNGPNMLTSIGGTLWIGRNDALTSLDGLNNISSVGDDLLIQYNNTLTSLNGLGNLSSVASFIIIGTNPALTSLNGLESLSSVGTDISIVLNESLTSITSLNNLSSLGGRLEIRGNNALTSIAGLSSLTSLDRLLIADNEALTSLQGLNNIASIASDLRIENNDTLTSIQALNNLSSVGGELRITDNTTLSTCSIDWICDSIYFPYQIMIISNNATGCNSKAEVEDDCPNLYEPVCQDATIALLFDGTASITPSEVDGGSIDVASSFVFPSDFTCKELGANIVSLVVIDIAGNIGACDATVTVEDPNNFCPDCTTYTATDTPQPVPVFGSGAFDCSSATTSTVDVDIPGQIGLGATRIDYLEMDITHTFNADLVITLIAPSGADIVLSVYGGGQNYTNTRFEDGFPSINSANAPFTGTFEPEEGAFNDVLAGEDVQGTWTLYVCDFGDGDIGTLNSFTLKICSSGYPAPPSITCPPDQTGSFNTNCQFSIPDYRSLATASSSTGSSPTITQSPAPGTQINGSGGSLNQLITLTVTDAVGNSSDCTFNLTVNDGTPPTISCPADITQTVDPGQTYATVINIAPVSSDDNCASPTITHAISGATTGSGGADASNTQFNIGSSVVTYTVTDAAGLIGNCSFTVDVTLDCGSILVNSTADNLTSGDGNCTLREAIRNVNAGSDLTSGDCNCGTTITFDASTNGTPIVLSLTGAGEDAAATGDLDITADVTITGNGSGNTIINGNNTDRVFHLTASSLNVTLEHLTVKDGLLTGSNSGGGLNSGSNNANLIISNCAFDSNQASSGGGLRIQNASTVEIDNCLFNGNIAYGPYGGGVSLSIGTYTIRNCSFQNNQTNTFGGGAYTTSGSYTFINCTMTGNTANNSGGAISNGFVGGVVKLTNCTIAKNTSPNGAAVDINNSSSFLSLTNNIIVNNISPSDLNIGGLFIQVNVQNIVESCSGSCPTFFSTSDDVICGLSTCANGLGYYPVIPNSDADGTADTSTPLADDICGNIRSASSYNIGSSEVFFTDNENPVVVCPATQTISNDAGECGANVSFTVPDPTDNCSATSSASPASGSFFNVGTTQVTVTATDGTGNTSQCTFDVIVNDTENPTISCPADVTQTVDAGQTYATVINIAPVSSDDNCASPTITHAISGVTTGSGGSDASGTQFNIGSSVVTYTIEDASNNTATCSFNVEVNGNAEIDVQDPDMNSLTNNASNYDFGNVDIMGGSASGTFTINNIGDIALLLDGSPTVAISGSASFSVTQPSSTTIAPAGATAFQIDYNPANEDCSQQMATISISNNDPDETPFVFTVSATPVDNVNPTANCPSNITQSNDTGQCGANVSFSIPAPSDNCPGVSAVASPASGFFFDVGTTSVTVIATDASNNTGSCTFTVTVTDTEDPSINCPADITVDNDSGLCSAVVNIPAPTVSDNCPGASFEYAPASGSAFDVGTTTVTATATDGAGNTATCTLNVTVNDTEDPAINCPADITVAATSGAGAVVDYTAPAGTDNCTPATMQTAGLASGATFPIGTTTNTFEVTDGAGNTSSCSFNITVDDVALDINCPADITVSNDQGECSAVVAFEATETTGIPPSTITYSQDPGTAFPVGNTTVTATATNSQGSDQCSFTVTVTDTEDPSITCPADITVDNDSGLCSAVVSIPTPTVADNCPGASFEYAPASGSAFDTGTTTVTATATDGAGNTATCTLNVTVNDTEDPAINCPMDITVAATSGAGAVVDYTAPVGTDNCTPATMQTAGLASGATFPIGTTTNTFEVTDGAGNTSSCSFNITVDDVALDINCPENITVGNDQGQCSAVVAFEATETTGIPPSTITYSQAPGTAFPVGMTTVTATATNSQGSDQCSFTVTVTDTEDPSINCPADITVDNDSGLCSAVVNIPAPTVADNCPGASFEYAPASGSAFDTGTTTVTATATDGAGNTATCTLNVTVNDTEAPAIACPADITVAATSGAGAVVDYIAPVGTDNCTPATMQTAGLASGATFPIGTTTNTFEVTDGAGNTSSCSFNVTVDDVALDINCPADITVSNDQGECSAVVAFEATETTGIPPSTITYSQDPGTAFPVGMTTVTATATNSEGSDQCSFTVTVTDTEDPSINCPADITVDNDSGLCSAVVNIPNPTVSDNCPGATFEYAPASGSAFDTGTTTVTATATDGAGNTATCTLNVTVNDTEDPAITCPADITVDNDPGLCSAVVDYTAPAGTDNCTPATMQTAGLASGATFPIGTTTNTFEVTDGAGNTSSCSFNVTVEDTEDPAITCPADITVAATSGAGAVVDYTAPVGTDNCTPATMQTAGLASGATFPIGTTTNTFEVTDGAGNTSSCSFNITVDDVALDINCPENITVSNDQGQCSAVVAFEATETVGIPASTITYSQAPGTAFPVGTTTVTATATNSEGSDQCSFTVTVTDTEDPGINCPADITVDNDPGLCSAVVSIPAPTVSDNCPGATFEYAPASGSAFDTGTTTVTATATDGAGNTATCTLNVTVNDTEDPAITCPADITVDNDPGLCSAVVNIPAPTVLDNCPGATFEYTPASGSAFEVGTTNVTATTADGAGNTASCTVNVTVNDDEAPNMVCKKSTVDIELGQTLLPEQVDSVSTDNCAITQLSVTPNLFGCGSLGLNTVTLTAQDAAGHSNTCTTTVNVIDNNPPTAVCNNPTVNLTSDGVTTVAAAFFDGGSAAVCPDGPVPGGGLDFSASMTAFDCDNLGETYTVTLTVTSQSSGLSGQCTSTVFVDDPNSYCCPPPMAVCENITVQLDASGNANITPTDIGSNSTAECGLQSEMLSNNSFGCTDAGPNTVTYTITDVNGDSDGCTVEVTVEDNISPSAVCLNTTVELQSDGTYILQESDVYDPTNSSDNCPYGPVPGAVESVSFPAATYTCDEAGKSFSVTVTVEDPSGNTDDCTAIVSVEAGTALPGSWTANDIGDPGEGSDYAYDPCTANNPDQGDFTISTGGYNLIPQTSDNLAFTAVPLCGNGGIQAHIKSVSGGYAGLMIRESSAPGAKMVAVYSNLTNLLRRETRIITNGARSNSTLFAAFPKWLRLIRQGNYIRAFYRNSSSGSWTLFHQAYVPMDECVEMGLAVFTTDPSGEAFAVFGNVNYQSQGGNNLSVPSGDYKIPAETKRSAVVFPNPALEQFTLSFSKPLTAPGTATLLNELGQRVRQFDLYSGDLEIDAHLSGLPPGLYFLRAATSDGYQETLKLLKQ